MLHDQDITVSIKKNPTNSIITKVRDLLMDWKKNNFIFDVALEVSVN